MKRLVSFLGVLLLAASVAGWLGDKPGHNVLAVPGTDLIATHQKAPTPLTDSVVSPAANPAPPTRPLVTPGGSPTPAPTATPSPTPLPVVYPSPTPWPAQFPVPTPAPGPPGCGHCGPVVRDPGAGPATIACPMYCLD